MIVLVTLLLALVRFSLRLFGMRRTVSVVRRLARTGIRPAHLKSKSVDEIALIVASAGALFIGRARCLEQSLALFLLLSWSDRLAVLKVGARALPFAAHAWVEVDGFPVNEAGETITDFVPFGI